MSSTIKFIALIVAFLVLGIAVFWLGSQTFTPSVSAHAVAVQGGVPYEQYSSQAYQQALGEGKVVFLDFHADWCSICQRERPIIRQAFAQSNLPNVVGFEVNYDTELGLRQKFGVPYQHTKVIVAGNEERILYKSLDVLRSPSELQSVLSQVSQVA